MRIVSRPLTAPAHSGGRRPQAPPNLLLPRLLPRVLPRLVFGLGIIALGLTGCLGERGGEAPATTAGAAAAEANEKKNDGWATIRPDVALPLTDLLGQPREVAEGRLGPPMGKEMRKNSCVRFAPQRIFFVCEFAARTYVDPTGTFGSVTLEYENGLTSRISLVGLPGDGPLGSWEEALALVGLELPHPPQRSEPSEGVVLWSWYNGAARLLIAERQHRVEVSVVEGQRSRARIDVTQNHPLSSDQDAARLDVPRVESDLPPWTPPKR